MKPVVVFDFDGVIHSYKSGWKGETVIPDPPVPGIAEAIRDIRHAGYDVVIVSTRCATDEGMESVKRWLSNNHIEVDAVMKEKPPAIVYIDDRAICFNGDPSTLLSTIKSFKPWYYKNSSCLNEEILPRVKERYGELEKLESGSWPAYRSQILGRFEKVE